MKEPATFIKLWRLGPPIALATVVFLIVAGAAMIFYNEQAYRQQKLDEVGVQARILSSTVSAALVFDDRPAAQEYVNAMAANFEVRAAAIYDQNGALFVDYVRGNAEMPPAQLPPDAPRIENGRLVVTAPVIEGQSALGTVYLQTITEPFARRLERYGIIGLLVFMASLIVAVLGAAFKLLIDAAERHLRRAQHRDNERRHEHQEADAAVAFEPAGERLRAGLEINGAERALALDHRC